MSKIFENITEITETIASENRCSFFDEHIYADLKAFICGDLLPSDMNNNLSGLPSFGGVVDKINSFVLRQDLRIRVITETLDFLLTELDGISKNPFFLVSYLCRETIKNAVLRKFNNVFGVECFDMQGLMYKIGDNIAEADKVFLSLRICDPSVHYGIFMRTMLNEMIVVKSQLGLLVDKNGNPLYKYKFVFVENGLIVIDKKEFRTIVLDGSTSESRYIRESLYNEKVSLLRNCLFGADTNPLSVLICKLRLWLEIIVDHNDTSDADLPYVEGNIICGDALVSRFSLKDDLIVALKNINQTVADYKRLSESIKKTKEPSDRQYLIELMTLIRNRLIEGIGWYSNDNNELLLLRRELSELMIPGLFPLSEKEALMRDERILLLHASIKKQEYQLSTFRHHKAFDNAVEWRYMFPELLNDKGDFIGFDAIAGLLPDTTVAETGSDKANFYSKMKYKVFKRTGNVSDMFCELANRLLAYGGCMSYILPSNWRRDPSGFKLADYIVAEMDPSRLLLFGELLSSYDILKEKCALVAYKDINRHRAVMCRVESSYDPQIMDIDAYLKQFSIPIFRLIESEGDMPVNESISSIIASNVVYMNISNKVKSKGLQIKKWDVNIYSGVLTGCDEAFFINKVTREELIHIDYKNSDIIKPLLTDSYIKRYGEGATEQWMLYIPWHFPLHYDKTISAASTRAEQRFQMQYPDVYNLLQKHKDALSSRNAAEVGLSFEWYALQRSGMKNNWDDFSEQKIVWKRDSVDFNFGIDYSGCVVLDDTCFMVGQHLKFLLGVFNSTMGRFILADLSRLSTNETQAGIFNVESMPVPKPGGKTESDIITLVNRRISENNKSEEDRRITEDKIDRIIYELYDLTEEEISYVKAHSD